MKDSGAIYFGHHEAVIAVKLYHLFADSGYYASYTYDWKGCEVVWAIIPKGYSVPDTMSLKKYRPNTFGYEILC